MKLKTKRTFSIALLAVVAATAGAVVAQTPQPIGTWAPLRELSTPLPSGASVALPDGRTLIAGGTAAGNTPVDAVTIYDAVNDALIPAGKLLVPRAGHTATLLKDGRVLVAGGVTDAGVISSDIERFDPATGTSEFVGLLTEPRHGHVAAALLNGTVLIAGGATINGRVLQSADIFDPETNNATPLPTGLLVARVNATATTLLDGRVLIAGGSNGAADLASAEIFERYWQMFTMAATPMSAPRQGHSAVMLPHNGGVLFAGGTSNGAAAAGTDLFLPAVFPDPFTYGEGEFTTTGAMFAPRAAAVAGPTSVEGYAFAATAGAKDAEVYRFATIKTDKDDYAPGQLAVITGSGWQANEEVTLLFQEDPAVHDDYVLKVQADSAGTIFWNQWAPEGHDFGVRFYLTATGSKSRAQMTFTDGAAETTVSVNCSLASVPSGSPTTCTTTVTNTASATWPKGSIEWSLTGGLTGSFSGTSCNLTQNNPPNSSSCSVTFTPDGLTLTGKVKGAYAPSPADWKAGNDQFNLTVTTTAKTTPTITFGTAPTPTFGGGNFTVSAQTTNTDSSALTYSLVSGPCALVAGSTFSSSGVGACVIQASGGETQHFNAASGTQTVTIGRADQAAVTVSVPANATYQQAGLAATAQGGSGTGTYSFNYGTSTACTVNSTTGALTITSGTGTCTITATRAADANYNASAESAPKSVAINKADATISVTGYDVPYNGTAHTATGSAKGVNNEDLSSLLDLTGTTHTNAGEYADTWTFAGDTNYKNASGAVADKISKAVATVGVNCPVSVTYNGDAQTPCSASVTGAGGLNQTLTVGYSNNTNAGTATASASYTGDANHETGSASKTFSIAKADATISISGYTGVYDGNAHGAWGTATGVKGESLSGLLSFGPGVTNVPGGTATWSFAGGTNYNEKSGSVDIVIRKWSLKGFYQPVGETSSFVSAPGTVPAVSAAVWNTIKGGQTVPLKFNIYRGDGGAPVTTVAGAFTGAGFSVYQLNCSGADVEESVDGDLSTGATELRWDGTQFVQNWKTPKASADACFRAVVTAKDGSTISAFFKVKK